MNKEESTKKTKEGPYDVEITKSNSKNKKYKAVISKDGKKVKTLHFGDTRYEHFKDKIGEYSNLDHNDKLRRERYLSRAMGIKNKQGQLTWLDPLSPNYYSVNYLW